MNRRKCLIALVTALVLLNLAFIWGNSLLPATESAKVSRGVLSWLKDIFAIFGEHGEKVLRKMAHMTEFASLGLLLFCLGRLLGRSPVREALLTGLAAACIDECIQLFVPGRSGSPVDVTIDFIGVSLGIIAAAIGQKITTAQAYEQWRKPKMKKYFAIFLALAMVLGMLSGCSGSNDTQPESSESTAGDTASDTATDTTPSQSESTGESASQPGAQPQNALELLSAVWALYGEDEKFPVMGGDMDKGNFEGPDSFDLAQAEDMTYRLLIPQEQVENVADAASMIHAMNSNTFTCGVFHLAQGTSAADFAAAMQQAIQGNVWMCGFPEELLIVGLGEEYVVAAFGLTDVMTAFQSKLTEAFPQASILAAEPISV